MGGGHVSRPDFGMPQPDPAHPLTEFYCLLQRALDREGVFALPALYAQFRAPARRIYADEAADFLTLSPDEEGRFCPSAGPGAVAAALFLPARHAGWCARRAAAHRRMHPDGIRRPAAAALRLGRPAPAPAGRSGGAEPHPHHAGRGRDRRLPRRAGPPSRLRQGGQTLAPPPPGRDLSLRAGSPLPAALPITEQKLSGSFAKTWRQMALLFLAYSCYTLGTLCDAGRKIFPLCTINCNNRGRSSVYRVNVPNKR